MCEWLHIRIDLTAGPEAPTNWSSREEIRPIFQICRGAFFALGYTISDAPNAWCSIDCQHLWPLLKSQKGNCAKIVKKIK